MNIDDLEFSRYDGEQALQIRDTIEDIYTRSYVDAIASGDPFDAPEAFMTRFDSYAKRPDFDMVVGRRRGIAVAQTWGWPLNESARVGWWAGLLAEPEPGFTDEDGKRTFALSEIMVDQGHTGQGVAHAIHDQLLSARHEQRATLLVEPDNSRAYRA